MVNNSLRGRDTRIQSIELCNDKRLTGRDAQTQSIELYDTLGTLPSEQVSDPPRGSGATPSGCARAHPPNFIKDPTVPNQWREASPRRADPLHKYTIHPEAWGIYTLGALVRIQREQHLRLRACIPSGKTHCEILRERIPTRARGLPSGINIRDTPR